MHSPKILVLLALVWAANSMAAPVDFAKDVQPLFEQHCLRCHQPTVKNGVPRKAKGGLRLDSAAAIRRGGDSGVVLRPGKPDKSLLYTRTILPPDHDDIMPSKGEPLRKRETALLRRWIAEGASFGDWTGVQDQAPKKPETAAKREPAAIQELHALSEGLSPAPARAINALAAAEVRVRPVAHGSPLLAADFQAVSGAVTAEQVKLLMPLKAHIVELDLGRCQVSDKLMVALSKMPRLVRLDLRQTNVESAQLRHLSRLSALRWLNLYGTRVDDKAIGFLRKIPHLEAVYLWQTRVTANGVKRLRTGKPKLKANMGGQMPSGPQPRGERD